MSSASNLEISAAELVRAVEAGEPLHVLDVRAPERLASGAVDVVAVERFHNVRGSQVLAARDPRSLGLDPGVPLAVVCGRGRDSLTVTRHLAAHGFDARSLVGGMVEWMATLVERELPASAPLDVALQFDRVGKGALAYLLASDGRALVVDPPRRTEAIEAALAARSLALAGVAETHVHADFLSGAAELARRFGVPHYLHGRDLLLPYDGRRGRLTVTDLAEVREIRLGRARIAVEETPGHTEGSVSFRVGDELVLSGDFVFVASVGRPDLGGRTGAWTDELFASLERARAGWPGDLRVLPGHYSDARERSAEHWVGARFRDLLAANEPLRIADRGEFRVWVAARAGDYPESYRRIKAINLALETPSLDEAETLEAGRNQCALA